MVEGARTERVVRTCDALETVPREAWDALVGADGSAFLEWGFLSALEATGCVGPESGWLASHLLVEEDGELVAAAPAYLKAHSAGEFVFDHAWADAARRGGLAYYPKLVVAVPFTPVHGRRLLVAPGRDRAELGAVLAQAAREVATRLGVSGVHWLFPQAQDTELLLAQGYQHRLGVQYHWHNRGYARFADWLEEFSSKRRRAIRRERRSVAESGVAVRVVEGSALTPELMRTMYALYLTTIDKKVWGRQYLNRALFEALLERWRERLLLIVAERDGRVVAGSLFALKGTELHGRYWGAFEEVAFLHFEVCYYRAIELCIERGLSLLGAGAQGEHKYERGFAPELTHSAHWLADARLGSAVRAYLGEERRVVRAEHAAMVSSSPCRSVRGDIEHDLSSP